MFKTEGAAQSWIRSRVLKGTTIVADEAVSFCSRLHCGEVGHYHHIAGTYLAGYACESAWREDHRRVDNGRQTMSLAGLAMMAPTSIDWCGYWQRSGKAVEITLPAAPRLPFL